MPQADILDALATWLDGELTPPVYYPDLLRSAVAPPPRTKALVITPGNNVPIDGDNGYAALARPRADMRCYGENGMQAMVVYRAAAEKLKNLRPRTVEIGATGSRVKVKLFNATLSAGPQSITDPDTAEVTVVATWAVAGCETEIAVT